MVLGVVAVEWLVDVGLGEGDLAAEDLRPIVGELDCDLSLH